MWIHLTLLNCTLRNGWQILWVFTTTEYLRFKNQHASLSWFFSHLLIHLLRGLFLVSPHFKCWVPQGFVPGIKNDCSGVPIVAQQRQIQLGTMRLWDPELPWAVVWSQTTAPISRRRGWGVGRRVWLWSTPCPGTQVLRVRPLKKKRQKKKKKDKSKDLNEPRLFPALSSFSLPLSSSSASSSNFFCCFFFLHLLFLIYWIYSFRLAFSIKPYL